MDHDSNCPRCGYSGFPDGCESGVDLWFCDVCERSYEVEPWDEEDYWEEEDKYADWDSYYLD
jgi:hypothetical protein